jgi:hypothetical protein
MVLVDDVDGLPENPISTADTRTAWEDSSNLLVRYAASVQVA